MPKREFMVTKFQRAFRILHRHYSRQSSRHLYRMKQTPPIFLETISKAYRTRIREKLFTFVYFYAIIMYLLRRH